MSAPFAAMRPALLTLAILAAVPAHAGTAAPTDTCPSDTSGSEAAACTASRLATVTVRYSF